jgi:WD40 repeat protein
MFIRMGRRWRAWIAGAAVICVIGALTYRLWADSWPARLTLGSDAGDVSLAFSPGGDRFATSKDSGIALWDCHTGRRRGGWAIPGGGIAVEGAYSPDGATFAAIVRTNDLPARLVLIDVATGRIRATVPTRHDRNGGLVYSADGSAIIVGSADRLGLQEVVVFDPASGREVAATRPAPPIAGSAVAISADRSLLAYFPPKGGPITLARAAPGSSRRPIVVRPLAAQATGAFDRSPDGRRCAIARTDGTIEIHDLSTGKLVGTLRAHSGLNASVYLRFSPDGRTLFSRGSQFNPPRGALESSMLAIERFRNDLYRSGPSEDLVVLDVATGRVLRRSADARHLHFSPDGRTVASRDRDGRIRLRELPRP